MSLALSGDGLTLAIVGSSGVGKSSLINRLWEAIGSVSELFGQTTRRKAYNHFRELITIPGGGLIIDTPGMREFQLWDAGSGSTLPFQISPPWRRIAGFGTVATRPNLTARGGCYWVRSLVPSASTVSQASA